jgi:outer membrane protein assembly factor BamB
MFVSRMALAVLPLCIAMSAAEGTAPLSSARLEWRVDLGGPAVGPAVHIGSPESTGAIAVALASGRIAVYGPDGGKGNVLWLYRVENGRYARTLPLIADADNSGRYEVYFGTPCVRQAAGIYALDALTGRRLWMAKALMQTYNSIVVADVNGDGRKKVFSNKLPTGCACGRA